jgi:hypothetical protein
VDLNLNLDNLLSADDQVIIDKQEEEEYHLLGYYAV